MSGEGLSFRPSPARSTRSGAHDAHDRGNAKRPQDHVPGRRSREAPRELGVFETLADLRFAVAVNGKHRLYATYSHYAGKASETQIADNSNVGTPNLILGQYIGPPGQGLDFAPGFNPANYTTIAGSFPVENVFFDESLGTPLTKEWTLPVRPSARPEGRGQARVRRSRARRGREAAPPAPARSEDQPEGGTWGGEGGAGDYRGGPTTSGSGGGGSEVM